MTFRKDIWPLDSVDQQEVSEMIECALMFDPNWKAPCPELSFVNIAKVGEPPNILADNTAPVLRRHIKKLWDALSPEAKQFYYLRTLSRLERYQSLVLQAAGRSKAFDDETLKKLQDLDDDGADDFAELTTSMFEALCQKVHLTGGQTVANKAEGVAQTDRAPDS